MKMIASLLILEGLLFLFWNGFVFLALSGIAAPVSTQAVVLRFGGYTLISLLLMWGGLLYLLDKGSKYNVWMMAAGSFALTVNFFVELLIPEIRQSLAPDPLMRGPHYILDGTVILVLVLSNSGIYKLFSSKGSKSSTREELM